MGRRPTGRDLFGQIVKPKRPMYEATLERLDRAQVSVRAERVRWLSKVIPRNVGFLMPMETSYVFGEAKSAYVYGHFVATVVLAAAFVEHWFAAKLDSLGYGKDADQGLARAVEVARVNNLVDPKVLDRIDHLRLIRNPFVHLKPFDHKYNLAQRIFRKRANPDDLLPNDAQDAILTMYEVAVYAFGRPLTRP